MTVRVEHDGPVTTVVIARPAVRNAVDGPMAAAFRDFDADPAAAVAVLTGDGGTFCSGADLGAHGSRTRPRITHEAGRAGARQAGGAVNGRCLRHAVNPRRR